MNTGPVCISVTSADLSQDESSFPSEYLRSPCACIEVDYSVLHHNKTKVILLQSEREKKRTDKYLGTANLLTSGGHGQDMVPSWFR